MLQVIRAHQCRLYRWPLRTMLGLEKDTKAHVQTPLASWVGWRRQPGLLEMQPSARTLFLGVSLFACYLSWSQFCDLTTDLTQGSLANSLGHSIKLAAMCLTQQSQAGPESDLHLTGVKYPSRGATDCLNFKGCILVWDPPPLS